MNRAFAVAMALFLYLKLGNVVATMLYPFLQIATLRRTSSNRF